PRNLHHDLHRMREGFAHELRARGVEADATCRRARGITRRTDNIPLRKVKDRLAAKGLVADTVILARQAGIAFARRKEGLSPWEKGAVLKQRSIRAGYVAIVRRLARSPENEDRELAGRLDRFVREMPAPLSHRLTHAVRDIDERRSGREGPPAPPRDGPNKRPPSRSR
ncbi:MAG: hypothetical protein EOP84_26205, partial [Verrucomicrobiaceae bacterium]